MGEVYKARDTRLERTVAIKVLPSHIASTLDGRRFLMVRRHQDLVPSQLNVILNWAEELKARVPVAR